MVCWSNTIPGCSFTVAPTTYATLHSHRISLRTKQMSYEAKARGLFVGPKGPNINIPSTSLTETSSKSCRTQLETCSEESNGKDDNSSRGSSMTTCHSFPPVSGKNVDLESRRHSDTVLSSEENFCFGEPTHVLGSSLETTTTSISDSSVPRPSVELSKSRDKDNSSVESTYSRERNGSVSSFDYGMSIRYWPAAIINSEMRVSASTMWVNPEPPLDTLTPSSEEISTLVASPNGSVDSMLTLNSDHYWSSTVHASPGVVLNDDLIFNSNSPHINYNNDHNSTTAAVTLTKVASTPISDADSPKVTSPNVEEISETLSKVSVSALSQNSYSTETLTENTDLLIDDQSDNDVLEMKDTRLLSQVFDRSGTSKSHEETTLNKIGILKPTVPLKISEQKSKKRKSVRFLDSVGQPLTKIKEFNESEELMEKIQQFEKAERDLSKDDISDDSSQPIFRFAFTQPAANYLQFRQTLEKRFVSLENVHFQGPRQFCGTVKVKNCAFEKKVFLRITFNSWESSSDIQCLYVDNGLTVKTMYDTFKFEVLIPSSWHTYHKIQFCCCFLENGREHWDNNDGYNYSIVSNLDEVNQVRHPGGLYSPLFSFWRANTLDDELHPYW